MKMKLERMTLRAMATGMLLLLATVAVQAQGIVKGKILDKANGQDLAFVTVRLVDGKGTICPWANDEVRVEVEGAARFKAICNGDATSLEVFTEPRMTTFHGQLVVAIEPVRPGEAEVFVSGGGLSASAKIAIR